MVVRKDLKFISSISLTQMKARKDYIDPVIYVYVNRKHMRTVPSNFLYEVNETIVKKLIILSNG